jgi:hypothetical protein
MMGLCSVDKQFRMHLWCELFPQATLTLNLMRTSRINPTISAANQLYGQFDFNRTPLAPPGTRAVAHVKPKARRSWAPHGEDAWYVGPAPDHYRCYKVCYKLWMVGTNKTRIEDTVEFFPQHVKMPHLSSQEIAIQASCELTFTLRNSAPAALFARLGFKQHESLARLANIFKESAAPKKCEEQVMKTKPSNQAPLSPMPQVEAPVSIPSLLSQHRSSPPRVVALAPRVEKSTPRAATPATPNSHRRLSRGVKMPTTIPSFDLYRQQRQTARSTLNKKSHPFHNAYPHIWETRPDTYLHIYKPKQVDTIIHAAEHDNTQLM